MALEATRQANAAITLHGRIQAMRGTWLGVLLHPQGHRAVVHLGDGGSGLQFWSLEPPSLLELLEVERGNTAAPDRVQASQRGVAWSLNQGSAPDTLFPVQATAASRSGDVIAVAAGPLLSTYRISADDAHLVHQHRIVREHASPVLVSLSSDGSQLLTADSEGDLFILSPDDGSVLHALGATPGPTALSFIWKDRLAAAGDALGRITCWNVRSGERHVQFQAHQGALRSIDFDPRKRLLLTTGDDGVARVWSLDAGTQVGDDIRCAAPLVDGRLVLGGELCLLLDRKRNLLVADSQSGTILETYTHGGRVWGMDVASARGRIVLVGDDGLSILAMNAQQLLDMRPSSATQRHSMSGVRSHAASTPSTIAVVPGGSGASHVDARDTGGRRRVPSGTHQTVGRRPRSPAREGSVASVLTDSSGLHVPVDDFFSSVGDDPHDVSHSQISTSGLLDAPEGTSFELDFAAADTSGTAALDESQKQVDPRSAAVGYAERSHEHESTGGRPPESRSRGRAGGERSTSTGEYSAVSYRRFEEYGDDEPRKGLPLLAIIGVALLAALAAGTLTWFSIVAGESGGWSEEFATLQEEHERERAVIQESLDEFEARQRELLDSLRSRTSLPSEIERMERRTFRIIESERETAAEHISAMDAELERNESRIQEARTAAATRKAGLHGLIAGLLFLLLGFAASRIMQARQQA